MSMNKENRQSHQRTQDVRWKPNAGEKPPAAICLYLLSRNSFYNDFVLVQSFTSTQAATCRELQLSLVFQSLLEGSYNPLPLFMKNQMINKYTTDTVYYRYQISNYRNNPEHLMNRNIQSTDHLKTGTHIFFLWPATGRSIPYAVLRADALFLFAFLRPTHPATLSRRVFRFRDAPNTTVAPRPLPQRRT